MKIKIKLLAGFFTIIIFIIILGVVSFLDATDMGKHFEFLVVHDLEVLKNAEQLQKFVVDAETGQRGFVITGEDEFLEPYYSGIEGFDSLLIIEKELVSDNPSQVQRLEKLSNLFEDWKTKAAIPEIELGQKIAENRKSIGNLEEILILGVGKGILDEIRELLTEITQNLKTDGNHKAEVVALQIAKDIVDRETGQRGFLVTGKDEFLEPYHAGEERLHSDIEKLRNMLAGEQESLQLLDRIEFLAEDWETSAAIPEINARIQINENPETLADAADLITIGTGKNILDQMRDEFAIFIQIEVDLKDQRLEQALVVQNNTKYAVIIISIISIIVAVSIALYAARNIAKPIELLTHATDQVARGNLKTKIKQFNRSDEIGQLSKSFNAMTNSLKESTEKLSGALKELKKSNVLKDEFATMVSHELKTPLTPIIGWCDALQDPDVLGTITPEQKKAVQTISSSAEKLEKLIGDLLDIQKLELGRIVFDKVDFQVDEMMDSIKNSFEYIIKQKQIRLVISVNEKIKLKSDRRRIEEVLSNMIYNAIDFVPEKDGRIELDTKNENGVVVFSVKDNGKGILKEALELIFNKFYQTDTSARRKHGGTGLGLAICKGIVEGLGGKIWVESKEEIGTTFYFTIPKGSKQA